MADQVAKSLCPVVPDEVVGQVQLQQARVIQQVMGQELDLVIIHFASCQLENLWA